MEELAAIKELYPAFEIIFVIPINEECDIEQVTINLKNKTIYVE